VLLGGGILASSTGHGIEKFPGLRNTQRNVFDLILGKRTA